MRHNAGISVRQKPRNPLCRRNLYASLCRRLPGGAKSIRAARLVEPGLPAGRGSDRAASCVLKQDRPARWNHPTIIRWSAGIIRFSWRRGAPGIDRQSTGDRLKSTAGALQRDGNREGRCEVVLQILAGDSIDAIDKVLKEAEGT